MTIVLDKPEMIAAWVWTSRMFQLALEINTDLKHRGGPILKAMHREGFIDSPMAGTRKNKQLVLRAMVEATAKAKPSWQIPASLQAALNKEL